MPKGVYKRNPNVRLGPKPSVDEQCDRLISRLYRAGWSLRELEEDLGLTPTVVQKSLKRTKTQMRSRANYGPKNGSWNGRRTTDGKYMLVRVGTHYVPEHRVVMEKMVGRPLDPKEVVHHKNGNPQDNRPENLVLFSDNATHLAIELTGHVPNWTEDGLRRIAEGSSRIPSTAGIPAIRTGRAYAVRLRKTMIEKFRREISESDYTASGVMPYQLPPPPPRSKIERETNHPAPISS